MQAEKSHQIMYQNKKCCSCGAYAKNY